MPDILGNPLPGEAVQARQYAWQFYGPVLGHWGTWNVAPQPVVPSQPQTPKKVEPEEEDGMALVNGFLVGCDPEFVALNKKGELINTAAIWGGDHRGEVGYDHGGYVLELRPAPAKGTATILKRLQMLLNADKLKALREAAKYRAGAYFETAGIEPDHEDVLEPFVGPNGRQMLRRRARPRSQVSLGGHVHLDLDPYKANGKWQAKVTDEHQARVAALDHLAHRLEALDILPRVECEKRRAQSGYGAYGDVRADLSNPNAARVPGFDENGNYHIPSPRRTEYRTFASWLFDPRVAFLCLTGAKLAAAAPEACIEGLGRAHSYLRLRDWFRGFASKDINAAQVVEKVLDKGLKAIQIDPDGDIRPRWEVLPV